jgi:glycosyltransferase involved in cell wall biosynthesis
MKPAFPSLRSIRELQRIVTKLRPDVIHGWLYHGSLAGQFASFFAPGKVPVIWSIHYSMYSLSFEKRSTAAVVRICAPVSRRAAAVVFVSHTSQTQHRALGFSARGNLVIPNGIDIDQFAPSVDHRSSVRNELGLDRGTLLIGLISRYHRMKDHANFLRAAAIVTQQHRGVHFLLAGREVDQNNNALVTLIRELGIADRVQLLGERADIPRLTAALDIHTMSSLYGESFPVIVGEAMACGVPCVVTDVGDSGWLVGNTGRIVTPGKPDELATAWKELLEMGSEERRALGMAARVRVADNFSLASIVNQYDELYVKTRAASPAKAESLSNRTESASVIKTNA